MVVGVQVLYLYRTMQSNLSFCLIILLFGCSAVVESLSCIGDAGKTVDWFIAYKLPLSVDKTFAGYGYFYMDDSSQSFQLSTRTVRDKTSAMGATLKPVYDSVKTGNNDVAYIFYNDQGPGEKTSSSKAHSKGGVAFDKKTGFWLIHSVPRYPYYATYGYGYPRKSALYGQIFLCVSFKVSKFDSIGKQLRFIGPKIHDSFLPQAMAQGLPNIVALLQGDFISNPTNHNADLVSSSNKLFVHFAKGKKFGKDLYYDLVAKSLKSNLLAETWIRGKKIGPSCGTYSVEDIIKIEIDNEYKFNSSQDHSKFAISKAGSSNYYVCVGDINRMTTQYKRGGGILCTSDAYIWGNFTNLIATYDEVCNEHNNLDNQHVEL